MVGRNPNSGSLIGNLHFCTHSEAESIVGILIRKNVSSKHLETFVKRQRQFRMCIEEQYLRVIKPSIILLFFLITWHGNSKLASHTGHSKPCAW
jgi:hypothetical protein